MTLRLVIISLLLAMLIGLLALCPVIPASAQSATATPTLAPSTYTTAQLSGGTLLIERRVTFGDLFVGFSALLVSVVIVASAIPGLGERLFKK